MIGTLDPISLTFELCAVPSVTGTEAGIMQMAIGLCESIGLRVRTQAVHGNRVNVLGVDAAQPPELLFTTHLDTVPPFIPPCDLGDRLTGRGTCDAKGAAAAMLCAIERLRLDGEHRVGVLFLVGEETHSDGAKAASAWAPHVRWIINGEPTTMQLARAQKGILSFRLHAEGIACHSAYPENGRNALHLLVETSHRLLNHAWPHDEALGETTLNLGELSGGVAINVLAPNAEAKGMFRLAAPLATVEETLLQLLPEHVSFERLGGTDPVVFHVPAGEPAYVVRFGSDVPYLKNLGTPLMLGPGSIHDAHTPHEYILKSDLAAAADRYSSLARQLLSS